ncbi:MAG: iron ABC transporter permease [Planctomycetota bacterium]|nr:MAG: iron ABC transporter permease [Planctomycetota bacterium]
MTPSNRKNPVLYIIVFAVFFLLMLFLGPMVGSHGISIGAAWRNYWAGGELSIDADILFNQRLPRVILGLFAGMALGTAGASFQALLRNPLASPFTLGVAGGSALGAVIAIPASGMAFSLGPFSTVQLASLVGALAVVLLVYILARRRGHFTMSALLLAGVTIALTSASLILFVRYLSSPTHVVLMDRWMMGGLDVQGYRELATLFPFLLPGLVLLFGLSGAFNQLAFGEELAAARGVNVERVKKLAFVGGSLVTASVVAVAGPIGFVGLIVPHAVRKIVGSDHRLLLPCTALAGGGFLVACDALSRTAFQIVDRLTGSSFGAAELPVGIITGLIGGPFFLVILTRTREKISR